MTKQQLIDKMLAEKNAKLEYEGKSKTLYGLPNGNLIMVFGDNFTGNPDGTEDPGANHNVGKKDGLGHKNLEVCSLIYSALESELKIPTQNVAVDLALDFVEVKNAGTVGKGFKFKAGGKDYTAFGFEFIARNKAWGSFLSRFPKAKEGDSLLDKNGNPFVEVSTKHDDAEDPFFTREEYIKSGIVTAAHYDTAIDYTTRITKFLTEFFAKRDIELIDIKMEYGVDTAGNLLLIDEISPGSLRAKIGGKLASKEEIYKALVQSA